MPTADRCLVKSQAKSNVTRVLINIGAGDGAQDDSRQGKGTGCVPKFLPECTQLISLRKNHNVFFILKVRRSPWTSFQMVVTETRIPWAASCKAMQAWPQSRSGTPGCCNVVIRQKQHQHLHHFSVFCRSLVTPNLNAFRA